MDDRERFQQLADHFERARDLSPLDASRYLALVEDQGLRAELESMLALDRAGTPTVVTLVDLSEVVTPRAASGSTSSAEEPGLDLPSTIGGYTVLGVIGYGASGVVLKARQPSTERTVAVKVLGSGVWNPAAIQRFRREIRLLGRLEHPGIARIYDAGTDTAIVPARPYFVMELVDGSTLSQWARGQGARRDPREIARVFVAIAEAMEYAHANGVVHRDLKPGNILVGRDGNPKILDFGVSGVMGGAGVGSETIDLASVGVASHGGTAGTLGEAVVGTVPYMSPEQFEGARAADARSDLYSIGVMMFECLAGRLPYAVERRSLSEAAAIIRDEVPSTLGRVERGLRGDLETVVARLLEKEPSQRYQSAAELAVDLRLFLEGRATRTRPVSRVERARRFARRYRGLLVGTIVAFATLLGFLGYTLHLWRESEARGDALSRALDAGVQLEYRRAIRDAEASLRVNDARDARRALERAPEDRRGWEWRYLAARAGAESRVVEIPGVPISIAAHSAAAADATADASFVLVGCVDGSMYRLPRGLGAPVPFGRRSASVSEIAISPDGREFVTVDAGDVRLPVFSTKDGSVLRRFDAGIGPATSVAWSRGGRWIGVGSSGGSLAVIDAQTGAVQRTVRPIVTVPRAGEGLVRFIEPASGGDDAAGVVFGCRGSSRVMLLPALDAAPIPLDIGEEIVERVGASGGSTEQRALIGLYSGRVSVFDGASGEAIRTIPAGSGVLRALADGPREGQFASGATDGSIFVWNVETGAKVGVAIGAELQVRGIAFDRANGELLAVGEDGRARSWNIDREVLEPVLRQHRAWVYALAFLADGTMVSGAGEAPAYDGRVIFWPHGSREPGLSVNPAPPEVPTIVWSLSPDPLGGVAAAAGNAVHLIARDGGISSLRMPTPPYAVSVIGDGALLAVARFESDDLEIYRRDGTLLQSVPLRGPGMFSLATRAGGAEVVVARGNTIRLFEIRADEDDPLKTKRMLTVDGAVTGLGVSGESERIAVGLLGGDVALLDPTLPPAQAVLWRVPANSESSVQVALSPDGTRVASVGRGAVIRILDAADGMQLLRLGGHGDAVLRLAFSPDGLTLATGSIDGTIRIWRAAPRDAGDSTGFARAGFVQVE